MEVASFIVTSCLEEVGMACSLEEVASCTDSVRVRMEGASCEVVAFATHEAPLATDQDVLYSSLFEGNKNEARVGRTDLGLI